MLQKSGCHRRVGRLQRDNKADSACDNTGIPQELLILLPMAVRTLPARTMCWHPLSGSSSEGYRGWCSVEHTSHQKCLPRGLAEGRKRERAEQEDYREMLEPPVLGERVFHVAQLFLWCLPMLVGSHNVSVCLVGEK